MTQITQKGEQAVKDIAARNQVSEESVMTLLHALQKGHGSAAQFTIAELGGMGQWSRGGMTQIGDMFNDALKQKVNTICVDLSKLLEDRSIFAEGNAPQSYNPSGSKWWPSDLGNPASTGGQNDMQYALFPDKHRLAVKQGDAVSVYDSGDHDIGGFSQAQTNGTQTLKFSSQHGQISTNDLKKVK